MIKVRNNKLVKSFTLSEVLIALVIIGIIAAITIPIVMTKIKETQFKTAYKKSYSDLSNVIQKAVFNNEIQDRTESYNRNATSSEWAAIKNGFSISKECDRKQLEDCWVDGDKFWGDDYPKNWYSPSFVDTSGRVWAVYHLYYNIYLVDVNGDKAPNKFGKDRWAFTLADENGKRICYSGGKCNVPPSKVVPVSGDKTKWSAVCHYPPCYYHTWLYKGD